MELQMSVSAVVVRKQNFLLIKRAGFDEFGKKDSWTLPCGRIENYEDPNAAILREVKEETNLKVRLIKPIGVWSKRLNEVWRISICYLCKYKSGELRLSKEHSDYLWLPLKNKMKLEKWINDYAKITIKELR